MSYIDLLYDQVMPEYKRKPTSAAPAAVVPKQEAEVVIQGEQIMPIEYQPGYKAQMPQSEFIRQNVNQALLAQQQEAKALSGNIQNIYGEREEYKKGIQDALANLQALSSKTYESPELDARIKALEERQAAPALPERSALAEAIMMFGAPVLGALTGEAGALAQAPAKRAAQEMFEGAEKREIDRVKLLKENTDKKIKALIDLKRSSQDSFDKQQAQQLEKVKAQLGATKELASMSSDDLKSQEDKLFKLNDAITKQIAESATDIAKIEMVPGEQAEKTKRAEIMANLAQQRLSQPTEGERKGAFQYGLMEQAEKNLQDLKKKYGDYPSMQNKWFRTQKNIAGGMFGTTLMSDFLNSKAIDPAVREQIQYELSFLESIGRIQSGAAINVGEWSQMREQYFGTYGDTPEAVKAKDQQRQKALEGVGIIAGKARGMVSKPKSVVSQFPRKVFKNGKSATVENEQELKEARSEGWK